MPFWFFNALMLLGLAAVAIPPIIHLLTRKRYDVVDWAAMQFLQVSQRTRRKIFLEELLLMLIRMGLIALFVIALAAPFITSRYFARWGGRGNRDVVLVFDGSYSMEFAGNGPTAQEKARAWAMRFLDEMAPGDSVAVLQAKQQVVPALGTLQTNPDVVRSAIQNLAPPRGGVDWPAALQAAAGILDTSQRAQREIIVLTDRQRFGWADDASLLRWELLASKIGGERIFQPRIWVVNFDPDRPENPANWSLQPLRTSRAVTSVGREVTFRTALQLHGADEAALPSHVTLEIDGRPAGQIRLPGARLEQGQVPVSFKHRFDTAGSHLITLKLDHDALPGDNRQDLAVEVVPALPVLIIDGDERPSPRVRGTDFLRDALAPARDPNPAVLARVMPINGFDPIHLTRDLSDEPGSMPRVLVLSNVPRLTQTQQEGIERFLGERGGVLVTCGDRADAKHYNEALFRGGQGWMPAQLIEPIGAEDDPATASRPVPASFFHPAVELFRDMAFGGLSDARFPRRWKVSLTAAHASTPIAMMTGGEPLLIERPYRTGRVILATVPLDNSWRTNLIELPAFVPMAHELVYHLASTRSAEANLAPGQPIRYRPADESPGGEVVIQPPDGEPQSFKVPAWPLVFEDTREPGVYLLEAEDGRRHYFVVQADARESQLAPASDEERQKVAAFVPNLTYSDDPEEVNEALTTGSMTRELWLLLLLGVFALLFSEIWMTRRMALSRV